MSELRFDVDWLSTSDTDRVLRDTSARLTIQVQDACLTRNLDTWSRTVRDSVLVSAYPLAMWLATFWWRLNFEPLPAIGSQPDLDWRIAHELAAANHGYVWPSVVLASDGESVTFWAQQTDSPQQSVNYLCNLNVPQTVALTEFQQRATDFIESVIRRAAAMGHAQTDLSGLWSLIREDMNDPRQKTLRMLEARMGFEPEECPDGRLKQAMDLQSVAGTGAMAELAPVFGKGSGTAGMIQLDQLRVATGLRGVPQISRYPALTTQDGTASWQQGVKAARQLRAELGHAQAPITNQQLLDLLGLTPRQIESWQPTGKPAVGVVKPLDKGQVAYLPRKRHPLSKRFEWARLVGAHLLAEQPDHWQVESDLSTATQKRQRAFAAEFLCPIEALAGFLEGDFSESAIEDAAERFAVSETTVTSLLANNGYLTRGSDAAPPYRMAYAPA